MTPSAPDLVVTARFHTDVGCERQVNEDCMGFFNPGGSARLGSRGVVAVVADGMGGHSAGEVASSLATEAVGSVFFEREGDPRTALVRAFAEANRRIYDLAQAQPDKDGMGTTCTVLALFDGGAWAAHVGDSRIYLLRDGTLFRMTEDDSIVGDMVRQGLISSEEARNHADKNVILLALGTQPSVDPTVWEKPFVLRPGDRFLLCTDGLHDLVTDDELGETLAGSDPEVACKVLIDLAKERGGFDNITVGVLDVAEYEESAAQPRATRQIAVSE